MSDDEDPFQRIERKLYRIYELLLAIAVTLVGIVATYGVLQQHWEAPWDWLVPLAVIIGGVAYGNSLLDRFH